VVLVVVVDVLAGRVVPGTVTVTVLVGVGVATFGFEPALDFFEDVVPGWKAAYSTAPAVVE
jgi:hypothetical protein